MSQRLDGKVAIVTGGNSGIGLAAARKFGALGASVAIVARNVERGEAAAEEIRAAGGTAAFFATDVANDAQMRAMVAAVVERFGGVDIGVNNAAPPPGEVGSLQPLTEVTEDQWDRMIDVNLKGVWLGMKYQIPEMLKRGGGAIVNVSSTAGGKGIAGMGPYVASKFGINGLTKVAALEFAKSGIRINAILPGPVDSPIVNQVEQATPGYKAMITGMVPMARMGLAEEIADAIIWLCSDSSSYVTGANIPIDGGMLEQ